VSDLATVLHNGDGLCYYDLHKELVGMAINRAEPVSRARAGHWRVYPKDPMAGFKDLRKGTASTATATWTGCARWKRNPATGASACGLQLAKRPDGLA
jgi:hypothetical protein